MGHQGLGVRWTMGDVSGRGYEALRLSIWGAFRLFGPQAQYTVCVNTVPLARARALTGRVPEQVRWQDATASLPALLQAHLDEGLAEGVAWKFAPLRAFPHLRELSLDNDCILWDMPAALDAWLEDPAPDSCLLAEDVKACFGQFAALCGPQPRNLGIRGLPAGFDLEAALEAVLREHPVQLHSELDEQGLQVLALSRGTRTHVVRVEEVSICSPFPPHLPRLGHCGAHFCGLNAKSLPWSLEGRPAVEYLREHWERLRSEVYTRVGLPLPPRGSEPWGAEA